MRFDTVPPEDNARNLLTGPGSHSMYAAADEWEHLGKLANDNTLGQHTQEIALYDANYQRMWVMSAQAMNDYAIDAQLAMD